MSKDLVNLKQNKIFTVITEIRENRNKPYSSYFPFPYYLLITKLKSNYNNKFTQIQQFPYNEIVFLIFLLKKIYEKKYLYHSRDISISPEDDREIRLSVDDEEAHFVRQK